MLKMASSLLHGKATFVDRQITLYTYALSPFGMKVYWSLVLKKLPFSIVYTTPITTPEISFTKQQMVPVLKIDDEWKLDSTPQVHWLDELFPGSPLTGNDESDAILIGELDSWVTQRFIPASFRHAIDNEKFWAMMGTGWKLASVMRKTSGHVAIHMLPRWAFFLRRIPFVQANADKVSDYGSLKEMDYGLLADLENYIGTGPFLGSRGTPSLADAAVYAQLFAALDLKMPGRVDYRNSEKVRLWLSEFEQSVASINKPPLYPGMGGSILN